MRDKVLSRQDTLSLSTLNCREEANVKVRVKPQDDGTWTVRVLGDYRHKRRSQGIDKVARGDLTAAMESLIHGIKEEAGRPEGPGV